MGLSVGLEPVRPLLFSHYVTHRCNLNCRYCCDGDGQTVRRGSDPGVGLADAKRLLSILRQAGDTLDVTGGEPLLRQDLEEILAHAASIGLRTVLNTKGIGLAGRPELLRYADVLVFSLDTLNSELLAGLIGRPRRVAEEILAGLDYALAVRHRTKAKIVIAAVATPDNLEQVAEVLDFAVAHGLGFPSFAGNRGDRSESGAESQRSVPDAARPGPRDEAVPRRSTGDSPVFAGDSRLQRLPLSSAVDADHSTRRPPVLSVSGVEAGRDQRVGGGELLEGVAARPRPDSADAGLPRPLPHLLPHGSFFAPDSPRFRLRGAEALEARCGPPVEDSTP